MAARVTQLYQFDTVYLQALCQCDGVTESHFVSYFTPFLQHKFRRRLRNTDNLEDAVHETFARVLTAVRNSGAVRFPERFGAFVNAVAANVAREFNRRQHRYSSIHDLSADPQDTTSAPDAVIISSEAGEDVRRVLSRLSPKDRDVLAALYFQEQDKDELCRRLGISRGYLRVLLCRAKKEFRRQFRLAKVAPWPSYAMRAS